MILGGSLADPVLYFQSSNGSNNGVKRSGIIEKITWSGVSVMRALRCTGLLMAKALLLMAVSFVPAKPLATEQSVQLAAGEKVFKLYIEKRQLKDNLKKIVVSQGQQVRIVWQSDETVDIHLHGYDIDLSIEAQLPAEMTFRARATGRFPITSHGFGEQKGQGGRLHHGALLYLEVYPD
jgi:hypothetical protein